MPAIAEPGPNQPPGARSVVERLEQLLARFSARGVGGADGAAVEELGKLYRAASNQLAVARARGGSARRITRLQDAVAAAHAIVYGAPERRSFGERFAGFVAGVPATIRATWPYHLLALGILTLGAAYGWLGASEDPDWTRSFVFPGDERTAWASREELLEGLRAGRDSSVGKKAAFAGYLWQHNTRVALMAFFLGFAGGIPTALLLLRTGVMLGTYTYTFHRADLAWEWWAWVLPHGVTELGAVVLLAGGGFLIGRTVVAPGERTRRMAFRAIRPDVVRLVALTFPMLLLAALLESFFRQSHLPDAARHVFWPITLVAWLTWLTLGGRRARRVAGAPRRASTTSPAAMPLPTMDELLAARDLAARGRAGARG